MINTTGTDICPFCNGTGKNSINNAQPLNNSSSDCMHDKCTGCKMGTCNGVHMMSCPCKKCSVTC